MGFFETPSPNAPESDFRQGDILYPVPFLRFMVDNAHILSPPDYKKSEQIDLTQAETLPDKSLIAAGVKLSWGMLLNQTCDLANHAGNEKPIMFARIVPAEERIKKFKADANLKEITQHIKTLANPGRTPTLFYLPECNGNGFLLPKSVVDLQDVTCLARQNIEPLKKLLKLRLTVEALQAFQERLTYCFGRFGAPDDLFYSLEEWRFEQEERERRKLQ